MPAGAIQLRNALGQEFGVDLPPTAALDFPTVLSLANFVAQKTHGSGSRAAMTAISDSLTAGSDDLWDSVSGERRW